MPRAELEFNNSPQCLAYTKPMEQTLDLRAASYVLSVAGMTKAICLHDIVSSYFSKGLQATLIITQRSPATSNESAHAISKEFRLPISTSSGAADVMGFAPGARGPATRCCSGSWSDLRRLSRCTAGRALCNRVSSQGMNLRCSGGRQNHCNAPSYVTTRRRCVPYR